MVKKLQTYKIHEKAMESRVEINKLLREKFRSMQENGEITMESLVRSAKLGRSNLYRWINGVYDLEKWVVVKKVSLVLGIKITVQK